MSSGAGTLLRSTQRHSPPARAMTRSPSPAIPSASATPRCPSPSAPASRPPVNSTYKIINNTGAATISGTFNHAQVEGSTVTAAGGRQFTISYVAGTGSNDVQLTEKSMLFVWDGKPDLSGTSADANWKTAVNWVGDVAPLPGDTLSFGVGGTCRHPTATTISQPVPPSSRSSSPAPAILTSATPCSSAADSPRRPAGTNTVNIALTLGRRADHFWFPTAPGNLVLGGAIHLAANTLTANVSGALHANGSIDGATATSLYAHSPGHRRPCSSPPPAPAPMPAPPPSLAVLARSRCPHHLQRHRQQRGNPEWHRQHRLRHQRGHPVSRLCHQHADHHGSLNLQAGSIFNARLTGGGTAGQFSTRTRSPPAPSPSPPSAPVSP